jgi:hypothetical protein
MYLPLRSSVDIVDAENVVAVVQQMHDGRRGGTAGTKGHTIGGMLCLRQGSFQDSARRISRARILKASAKGIGVVGCRGTTGFALYKGRGQANGRDNGVGGVRSSILGIAGQMDIGSSASMVNV